MTWLRALWTRVYRWFVPPPVAKPTEIVGADYLADYQDHYKKYQAEVLKRIRGMADGVPNEYAAQRAVAKYWLLQLPETLHEMVVRDQQRENMPSLLSFKELKELEIESDAFSKTTYRSWDKPEGYYK